MNHETKHAISAIVHMYGYELIRRGFVERDVDVCRALQHIGEVVHKDSRRAVKWTRQRFEFEGWDAVRGETTE